MPILFISTCTPSNSYSILPPHPERMPALSPGLRACELPRVTPHRNPTPHRVPPICWFFAIALATLRVQACENCLCEYLVLAPTHLPPVTCHDVACRFCSSPPAHRVIATRSCHLILKGCQHSARGCELASYPGLRRTEIPPLTEFHQSAGSLQLLSRRYGFKRAKTAFVNISSLLRRT